MSKKEIKEQKSIIELIKNNYAWVIAIITSLSIVMSYILEFIEYLTGIIYFDYYGLNMNLYQFNDKNFFYSMCLSIIYMFAFYFLLYTYKQLKNNILQKQILKYENAINACIIFLSNYYLVLYLCSNLSKMYKILNFVLFILLEYIFSNILFKETNDKESDEFGASIEYKKLLTDKLKSFVFVLVLLIFCNSIRITMNLKLQTRYRIINDNKVIVYSNNDYSLTIDCKIDNGNLIMYQGTQTKINNFDVYSELKKFQKVEIK